MEVIISANTFVKVVTSIKVTVEVITSARHITDASGQMSLLVFFECLNQFSF